MAPPSQHEDGQEPANPDDHGHIWNLKVTLRIFSTIFGMVLIGICGAVWLWNSLPIITFLPVTCVAIVLNITECCRLSHKGRHRGMPPIFVAGIELLFCIGYLASIVLVGNDLFAHHDGYDSVWHYQGPRVDGWGATSIPSDADGWGMSYAIFGFGIAQWIVHFTIFVIAGFEFFNRKKNI
ncbi:hypothetical protein BGZ63DRAFT_400362 [Mariannaea sp. PMI_226]|nr:hypothetical protein BGZ63DRAFT_400362 [Mariannaea sp. PMI_226]